MFSYFPLVPALGLQPTSACVLSKESLPVLCTLLVCDMHPGCVPDLSLKGTKRRKRQISHNLIFYKFFLSIPFMRINGIQCPRTSKHYNVLFNHNHWKYIRWADFNQWSQLHCGQTSALRSGEDPSPLICASVIFTRDRWAIAIFNPRDSKRQWPKFKYQKKY